MQSHYYRLDKELNANVIMQDISKMIKDHAKVNKLKNTILKIELKDIAYSYDLDEKRIANDRKDDV